MFEAAGFTQYRLPEVFAGYPRSDSSFPVRYPTASSPQAWATGSPLLWLRLVLGLDVKDSELVVDPAIPPPFGTLEFTGLHALGRRWDGNFRQLQASASFALVQFQTNRGAVWFKAVGEPNLREFPITAHLADQLPRHIPVVLARHSKWNAWLALEAEGQDLYSSLNRDHWCRAADSLAELQSSSIENALEMLAAGARDIRSESLLALAVPFFARVENLMEQQTKPTPKRLTSEEIKATQQRVIEALLDLEAAQIPDTINHLDLNPFFSMESLRQHFVRAFQGQEDAKTALLTSYLDRWRSILPAKTVETALRLAPLTALFAYAASSLPWHLSLSARPELAGFLRSLMRRMHRESEELSTSRAA